ncbi:MAG: putative DNA binding domain-containing protein [Oscillospiraceae bacterium]|nr:putative DNA binding domain-containing protein [Oscillospiraceae bacterium]
MKLSDLIGETTEYDKKEMLEERKPKSWLKSVSAFANGIGGTLIFGVSDDETPDGSAVQNLDTDNVISKRRNPVIADVFSRMNYMERRGSGFKKIKDDYHFAVNYRPELEPKFYSDISTFKVTLYNLNYNVPVEKVAFDSEKVAFERYLSEAPANAPTKEKARALFDDYGYEYAFSRSDIVRMFDMAYSSADKFITRLKDMGMIEAVSGQGKGKYKFVVPKE